MKNKKYLRSILALLTTSAIALQIGGCGFSSGSGEWSVRPPITAGDAFSYHTRTVDSSLIAEAEKLMPEGVDLAGLSFEKDFTMYDPSELYQRMEDVRREMKKKDSGEKVLELYDQVLEFEDELYDSLTLVTLFYYRDCTDPAISSAYDELTNLAADTTNRISLLSKEMLSSACGKYIRKNWSASDIFYYENYGESDEEQAELLELTDLQQDLIAQYTAASLERFTVTVKGKEYDLNALYASQELTDEEYRKAYTELTKKQNEVLGPIYVELVKVNNRLAKACGYDNYTKYAYSALFYRDFTPKDASRLSACVKDYLPEAYYYLYDISEPELTNELDRVFGTMDTEEQLSLMEGYLPEVSPSLLPSFLYLKKYHLYDLAASDTKSQTGFTIWLDTYSEPFILNQPEGDFFDFMTIIHEFGHFNAMCTAGGDGYVSTDLAEIYSQGLEALFASHYTDMFGTAYGTAASDYTLLQLTSSVLDGCMYDEFQQRVYALEEPTLEEINRIFYDVSTDYGYSYASDGEAYEWVNVPHNYSEPFYYISYAVSAMPALELWRQSLESPEKAVDQYLKLVAYDGDGSYISTLKACGFENTFHRGTVKKVANALKKYIATEVK